MSAECLEIHKLANNLKRYYFPFESSAIPQNGIYFLFENNELAHNQERIVRVGTHTGYNRLYLRLKEHFLNENKDRSIFRKNIGRALLNQRNDKFLAQWELDLTSKKNKAKYSLQIDFNYQQKVEKEVSRYIQENFSFSVIEVLEKVDRLTLISKLISTISLCDQCCPSPFWLGNNSPKEKIQGSGLWLVNGLYKTPCETSELNLLSQIING